MDHIETKVLNSYTIQEAGSKYGICRKAYPTGALHSKHG